MRLLKQHAQQRAIETKMAKSESWTMTRSKETDNEKKLIVFQTGQPLFLQ